MSNLYLLSGLVNGTETFYTADISGSIKSIGTTIDWSRGFTSDVLASINNSVYISMTNPKVYTNNASATSITEETTGAGLVWSTYATAINCIGYAGLSSLTVNGSADNKYAISFGGIDTPEIFYTRGTGTLASNTAAIPTDASSRTTAGVTIPSGTDLLFDGNTNTEWAVSPSTNTTIPVEFTTALVPRHYKLDVSPDTRLPMEVSFQVFDDSAKEWVNLDTITVKAVKQIDRYFSNSIQTNSCRWLIKYNTDAFGDDPSKRLSLTSLNVYGQTTGTTWITCKKSEVATLGMSNSTLTSLTQSDYALIFNQSQINWIAYIPSGCSLTSITASFPANAAPVISNVIADRTSIHAGNVTLMFTITDPEGSNCSYSIFVNDAQVLGENNIPSGSQRTLTMENEWFNLLDDETTTEIESNIVKIVAEDDYGASSTTEYKITKVDKLPTFAGVLNDNVYTFSIDDANHDKVKYEAYLNDVKIDTMEFTDVPITGRKIPMNTSDLKIGESNTLKIVITDAVGGSVIVTDTFIGEYRGLLFYDENNTILSSDVGVVLNELIMDTIVCGQTTLGKEVFVQNKTNDAMKVIAITSPKDINGTDTKNYTDGVYVGSTHTEGNIYVQLSLDDSFDNAATFYSINLPALAPTEKTSFFMRVASMDKGANGGTIGFTVKGVSST